MTKDEGQIIKLFEEVISEDPTAYQQHKVVYQVTEDEVLDFAKKINNDAAHEAVVCEHQMLIDALGCQDTGDALVKVARLRDLEAKLTEILKWLENEETK